MTWRQLISKMEPGKKYYIDQLMKLTDEREVVLLALIRAAGKYIDKHGGYFELSFEGTTLHKQIKQQQQNNKNDA